MGQQQSTDSSESKQRPTTNSRRQTTPNTKTSSNKHKQKKKKDKLAKSKKSKKTKTSSHKQVIHITNDTVHDQFLKLNATSTATFDNLSDDLQRRASDITTAQVRILPEEDSTASSLTSEAITQLTLHLHLLPSLHTLDLSNNNEMDDQCAVALASVLPALSNIVRLDLSSCHRVGASSVFSTLYKSLLLPVQCSLTALILRDVQLTDADFASLLMSVNRLHTLDVSENQLTDASMQVLSSRLLETSDDTPSSTATPAPPTTTTPASTHTQAATPTTSTPIAETSTLPLVKGTVPKNVCVGLGLFRLSIGQNNTRISTSVDLAFLVVPKLPLMKSFNFGHGISTLKKVVAKSAVAKNAMVRTMPCSTPLEVTRIILLAALNRQTNSKITTDLIVTQLLRVVQFDLLLKAIKDMALYEEERNVKRREEREMREEESGEDEKKQVIPDSPLFWALHHKLYLLVEEILHHDEYAKMTTIRVKQGARVKTAEGKSFVGTVRFQLNHMLLNIPKMVQSVGYRSIKNEVNRSGGSMRSRRRDRKKIKTEEKQPAVDKRTNLLSLETTERLSSGLNSTSISAAVTFPKEVEVDTISKALAVIFCRPASRSIKDNRTALHLALRSGNIPLVFSLLQKNRTSTSDIRETAQDTRQNQSKRLDKESLEKHRSTQHRKEFKHQDARKITKSAKSTRNKSKKDETTNMLWVKHKLEIGGVSGNNIGNVTQIPTLPSIFVFKSINPDTIGLNEIEYASGFVPLRIACRLGMKDVVNELLDLGANVQAAALSSPCQRTGSTALHEACLRGMKEFVSALLKCPVALDGLKYNITNQQVKIMGGPSLVLPPVAVDGHGRNPLLYSIMGNEFLCMKLNLLSLSGGLNKESRKNSACGINAVLGQVDDCNRTPLSLSVQWQWFEATKCLIQAGAKGLLESDISSAAPVAVTSSSCFLKRCLTQIKSSKLFWFFTLDMNWVDERLIVENRLSPYGVALLRYDQAQLLVQEDDDANGRTSTVKDEDFDPEEDDGLDELDELYDERGGGGGEEGEEREVGQTNPEEQEMKTKDQGSESNQIELVIHGSRGKRDKEALTKRKILMFQKQRRFSALNRIMQPQRAGSKSGNSRYNDVLRDITSSKNGGVSQTEKKEKNTQNDETSSNGSGGSGGSRSSGSSGSSKASIKKKKKQKLQQRIQSYEKAQAELREIALYRIRGTTTNEEMAKEVVDQVNISKQTSNEGSDETNAAIRISPLERRDVALSMLRLFDDEKEIQQLRFKFSCIRVREEALLYVCFFCLMLFMSLFLTVGDLRHPVHYHRFLIASSDKVAGQDVAGLPPPNKDFASIQSVDHWHLWMNGAVMSNLFPDFSNSTSSPSTYELHQNGLLDGSLIILDHHVRVRQIRRRKVPCDQLTHVLAAKDVPPSSKLNCLSTTYTNKDFINEQDQEVFLNTTYTNNGGNGLEIPWYAYSTTSQYYPAGGFVFTLNTLKPNDAKKKWQSLAHNFIDDQTAAVFLEYAIYNPHLDAVALVRCLTEFSPSKRNEPTMERKLLKTEHLFTSTDHTVLFKDILKIISELILSILAFRYLLIEFEELVGSKYCSCCQYVCCQHGQCNQKRRSKKPVPTKIRTGSRRSNDCRTYGLSTIWFRPMEWNWNTYFSKLWNLADILASVVILIFCVVSIWVHYYKAQLNMLPSTTGTAQPNPSSATQWETIVYAADLSNVADDVLGFGFLIWGVKLFKIVQLVPIRAGRIFEAIGGTLVAKRVVVILLFIFLLMVIFTISFHMMYSSNDDSYGTVLNSFFSTYHNMLGDGDYDVQKASNFILGQVLWFVAVLTLSIIMLNIFIAVVSVEYENLEDIVEIRFRQRIDRKLIHLLKKNLKHCHRIGLSKTNQLTAWYGLTRGGYGAGGGAGGAGGAGPGAEEYQEENDENDGNTLLSPHFEYLQKRDQEYRNMLYPVSWRSPPLPSPAIVERSSSEIFEQTASISDQISNLKKQINLLVPQDNNKQRVNSSELNVLLSKIGNNIELLAKSGGGEKQ